VSIEGLFVAVNSGVKDVRAWPSFDLLNWGGQRPSDKVMTGIPP
jgi:hypothetical protein